MEEKRNQIIFPIQCYDKCPSCGCEEGHGATILKQLKDNGKLSENYPETLTLQAACLDPVKLSMEITPKMPVISFKYEVCKDCSMFYIKSIDLTWQPVQLQAQPPPPGLRPPIPKYLHFGKG